MKQFVVLTVLVWGALAAAGANREASQFDWRNRDVACPTQAKIAGQPVERVLAQDILRAELQGWRTPSHACLDPSIFKWFRVAPVDVTDFDPAQIVTLTSASQVKLLDVKLVWPAGNWFEASYSLTNAGKTERGTFRFRRIEGAGPARDENGCATMVRFPTHVMTLPCHK